MLGNAPGVADLNAAPTMIDGFGLTPMAASDLPHDLSDEQVIACAGEWLTVKITEALGADYTDVWDALTHLPDGCLPLLESPEGWAALGTIVATDLGFATVPVVPLKH